METVVHVLAAAFYLLGSVYYAVQIYLLFQSSPGYHTRRNYDTHQAS